MEMSDHHFVSISVVPVDARLAHDGGVEYAEAPERQQDNTPEQVCDVCWVPLDAFSLKAPCPGPKVPDDPSALMSPGR